MPVDPALIRRIADEAGFMPITLEKVARLEDLLREIARHPQLGEQLALKGGTAINFVLLPEAPRLSVDIDFNYVGKTDREEMRADRLEIESALKRIFGAQGYDLERRGSYGATGWNLRYSTIDGARDYVKAEVNWLLRVPIWTPERLLFRTVFPEEPSVITVLVREEVVAGKIAALLNRAAPRDLFDFAALAEHGAMGNQDRIRRATVLLGTFYAEDFRERLDRPQLSDIDERRIRAVLWPTLRRDLRPTLEDLRSQAESALSAILSLGERERRYLDAFYDHNRFDPAALFEKTDANTELPRHPMAQWRLLQRSRAASKDDVDQQGDDDEEEQDEEHQHDHDAGDE